MRISRCARHAVVVLITLTSIAGAPSSGSAHTSSPTCFGREATITGTGLLRGTPGPDVIVAHGASEVHALGGDDRICGAFLVYAGNGDDRVRYSRADGDFPELDGGAGDDRLLLGGGRFGRLVGRAGDDVLGSAGGEQFLIGGAGRDRLFGGAGADTLIGGTGLDRADGGPGRDSCTSAEATRSC